MNDNRLNSKELAKIDFAVELAEKAHTGITMTAEQARNLLDTVAYWVQRYADTTEHLYAQRDDLQAQLASRTVERDEARRVALALYQEVDPVHEYPDIPGWYCSLCRSRTYDDHSGVIHEADCPIVVVENWPRD